MTLKNVYLFCSVISSKDGVRLLWSALRHANPEAQASAAWAICPCIEHIPVTIFPAVIFLANAIWFSMLYPYK